MSEEFPQAGGEQSCSEKDSVLTSEGRPAPVTFANRAVVESRVLLGGPTHKAVRKSRIHNTLAQAVTAASPLLSAQPRDGDNFWFDNNPRKG